MTSTCRAADTTSQAGEAPRRRPEQCSSRSTRPTPSAVYDVLVHDPTTTENFIFYPTHTTHPDVISAVDALPARLANLQGVRAYAYCGYGAHDFEADPQRDRLWLMYQHIGSRVVLAIDAYAVNDVPQLSRLLRNKHAYLLTRDLQHSQDSRDRRHDHSHKRRHQPYSKNHGKLMPRSDKMGALHESQEQQRSRVHA